MTRKLKNLVALIEHLGLTDWAIEVLRCRLEHGER